MVTVGLDSHKRYITAYALDDTGMVLAEVRRLDPTRPSTRWGPGSARCPEQLVRTRIAVQSVGRWLGLQLNSSAIASNDHRKSGRRRG
jgi:hypothetical protein